MKKNSTYASKKRGDTKPGLLLTLRIVEAGLVVAIGVSVRGFFERGSSFEGSSALFFKPTTSAGGVVTIFSTSARSTKSAGFSQTDVLHKSNKIQLIINTQKNITGLLAYTL